MNKLLKLCFISAFGLVALQAIPSQKGNEVKVEESFETSGPVKRAYLPNTNLGILRLTEPIENNIQKDKLYSCKFTASTSGYYVFEAESEEDLAPCICLDNGEVGGFDRVYDDGTNAGSYRVSRIRAYVLAGQQVRLFVKRPSQKDYFYYSEWVTIRVRKPKLSVIEPFNADYYLHGQGTYLWNDYLPDVYEYMIRTSMNGRTSLDYAINQNLFNHDVFLFLGKGPTPQEVTSDPSYAKFDEETYFNYTTDTSFKNTTLAFWGASYTAKHVSDFWLNVPWRSVEKGATCAIGFKGFVPKDEMAQFELAFLNHLDSHNVTIMQAYNQTIADNTWNDYGTIRHNFPNVEQHIMFYGNSNVTIYGKSVSNGLFPITTGGTGFTPIPGPGVIGIGTR